MSRDRTPPQQAHTTVAAAAAVIALTMLLHPVAAAQITQVRPVDVKAGLASGAMHLTIAPPFGGDSTRPFDGNAFSEMAVLKSDSLVLTLQLDTVVQLQKSRTFFWNYGRWMLEGALSLADLDTRSGSYALLADSNDFAFFTWDSVTFAPRDVRYVRLRARNLTDSSIYLGEWTLESTVTFTSLLVLPYPTRIVPGAALQLRLRVMDSRGRTVDNFITEPLTWATDDPAIATVSTAGVLTGHAVGSTRLTVQTASKSIAGSATVAVVPDFRPPKAAPLTVKVALVLQDPRLPGDRRLHQEFAGWRDPMVLSNDLVRHFREASDSVVNFQFVEIIWADTLFTRFRGTLISTDAYVQLLREPGWTRLRAASDSGLIAFDYRTMVRYYQYDLKRNSGAIDEVWVFSAPFLGMYESQLMGPTAFWWNSPPIRDGTALTRLLSVMGLNYERGVDQAFHSFGHRVESAMVKAYQDAQGRSWNPTSANPTPWDLFTRIDKDLPGQAHVGNIHFPPNGRTDYDYGNSALVTSYAENWLRYPYLFDMHSQVNAATWTYTPGDPLAETLTHLGYLRWWYNHLPRYDGVRDGVLNNWWHYALDYEAAVARAKVTPELSVNDHPAGGLPADTELGQNYPNPFNPSTAIDFTLRQPSTVTLAVYDLLGRKVATLAEGKQEAGQHRVLWDARAFASGIYFYRLSAGSFAETRKMILVK